MKTRGPLWKVCIRTTPEAEDAVTELMQDFFNQPASSYTDVETGEVSVAVYFMREKRHCSTNSHAGISPSNAGAASPSPIGWERAGVRALPALKKSLHQIARYGLNIGRTKISIQKVRREDWAESWKRHFKPIEIGLSLLIKPSWSKRRARKGQAVVVLDPGLSFGTGQHPTTAFCLQQLVSSLEFWVSSFRSDSKPETPNPKPSFLDIGTGSGILAIAAAKLGFEPVEAFDFDPEAVRIARENTRKNGVSRRINIRREDVTKLPSRSARKFDIICANLISTLLLAERRRILPRLQKGGILVLAGILKNEFASVQKAYEDLGMRLIASRTEKEWRSGAFQFRK